MADEFTTTTDVTADPSPAPDTASPPPEAPDATAPSSSAERNSPSSGDSRQSDRDGLLAAVRKVVETRPDDPALPSDNDEFTDAGTRDAGQVSGDQAAATGTGQPAPDATSQEQKPLADPTEAELKKLRPETRRRFEALLAQRNEARTAWESVQPELQSYRQLQGYLTTNQLASDDVNVLLGVGAALRRGDYQAFLNGVTPYVLAAQEAVGARISPDLQKQVDEGLIDESSARELTRTRHRAAQAEARLQEANQVSQTQNEVRHGEAIRGAVDAWEARIQRQDPDYARVAGAVRRYAQGLLQERGPVRSQQEAVALVQSAYDEVRTQFGQFRPAVRPTRPSPSSIHVATGTSGSPPPRNLKEAVLRALQNGRAS